MGAFLIGKRRRIKKMKKFMRKCTRPVMVILVILLILTLSPVIASAKTMGTEVPEAPVTFEATIEVTKEGGTFDVGFTTIKFPKNCLDDENLPLVVDVEIYAEDGIVYIEFTPDVEEFNKPVKITASKYKGFIYDRAAGENIYVKIPKQKLWVTHFSRYCFVF